MTYWRSVVISGKKNNNLVIRLYPDNHDCGSKPPEANSALESGRCERYCTLYAFRHALSILSQASVITTRVVLCTWLIHAQWEL
jgi:hypothetical protein